MKKCLVCESNIESFLSFPQMPIANNFLSIEEFSTEVFYNLGVGFCPQCHMVQLTDSIDPEKMFHQNYAFYSSTSTNMQHHFKTLAKSVLDFYITSNDAFVVELGSNDGILLKHFNNAGIRHLGIEPSANVAQVAKADGLNVWIRFFDQKVAEDIVAEYGHSDVIVGANVMCHIAAIHDVIKGMQTLLKPGGYVIFEDPYVVDIIEKNSYDQIYDEHIFYFSLTSVANLFRGYGFQLVDAVHQNVHGGSMRYILKLTDHASASTNVRRMLDYEMNMGINQLQTYLSMQQRIEKSKSDLVRLLADLKAAGKRVVGYGATSKSTTVLNYCGIDAETIEFISDTTPIKQGKFSPGMHIPIKPHQTFKDCFPDYALLFAWNHAAEIIEKEKEFTASGGKWIVYVPHVKVIDE